MKKLLKWLLAVAAVLVSIPLAVGVYGAILPTQHEFTRDIYIGATPEAVWSIATDYAAQTEWVPGLRRVEQMEDQHGRQTWRIMDEHHMSMLMRVVAAQPPLRLVRSYSNEGAVFSGEWEMEITPEGSGSKVVLTERGHYRNWLLRGAAALIVGQDKFVEEYLEALKNRAEKK